MATQTIPVNSSESRRSILKGATFSRRVLLVDDEMALEQVLADLRCEVITALSGEEAFFSAYYNTRML